MFQDVQSRRVIFLELTRILNHLLAVGCHAMDVKLHLSCNMRKINGILWTRFWCSYAFCLY